MAGKRSRAAKVPGRAVIFFQVWRLRDGPVGGSLSLVSRQPIPYIYRAGAELASRANRPAASFDSSGACVQARHK